MREVSGLEVNAVRTGESGLFDSGERRASHFAEFFAKTKAGNTSNNFKSLITKMLSCNSSERPTIQEI